MEYYLIPNTNLKKIIIVNKKMEKDPDLLSNLPTDKNEPTQDENKILNTLFKEKKTVGTVFVEFKESIIVGILFIIFSLSYVDDLILKISPSLASHSPYIIIGIKAILIVLSFWILKHFYLIRKE